MRSYLIRGWMGLLLCGMAGGLWAWAEEELAEPTEPLVYVIPLKGEVERGLFAVMRRGFQEAEELDAKNIIVEMNTPGGRVDAALEICSLLLDSERPTTVLVSEGENESGKLMQGDATSAGAIIAICAEKMYMTPRGTIGTAAPIVLGEGGQANPAGEKAVSLLRAKVREAAKLRDRDDDLCQAMIDQDVEVQRVIDGETIVISEEGKLLTLTSEEAMRYEFVDGIVETVPELLEELGLPGVRIFRQQMTPTEIFARFVSSIAVSGLLLSLGLLGIFIEFRTPGFGLPGIAGILCVALVFWGHAIANLAGWEGPLLFAIGIVLLTVEIFITPGFGAAGTIGLFCVLGSFVITLMERGPSNPYFVPLFSLESLVLPILVTLIACTTSLVGFFALPLLFPALSATPFGRRLLLVKQTSREEGYVCADPALEALTGQIGTVLSDSRPAGIATIEGQRVHIVSEGGFIPQGTRIEVLRVEGRRVVVRPATH